MRNDIDDSKIPKLGIINNINSREGNVVFNATPNPFLLNKICLNHHQLNLKPWVPNVKALCLCQCTIMNRNTLCIWCGVYFSKWCLSHMPVCVLHTLLSSICIQCESSDFKGNTIILKLYIHCIVISFSVLFPFQTNIMYCC